MYEPCSPGEPNASQTTLGQLAEQGKAAQVLPPFPAHLYRSLWTTLTSPACGLSRQGVVSQLSEALLLQMFTRLASLNSSAGCMISLLSHDEPLTFMVGCVVTYLFLRGRIICGRYLK